MSRFQPLPVSLVFAVFAGAAVAQDQAVTVTDDNFATAMTDMAMEKEVEQGANLDWHHHRKTMALDEQPAPLMNRDTVYSFAVLDGRGDLAITLPENDGRYMSLHVMNHDHVTYDVFYGPGRYELPASGTTDYFYANARMQINDKNPEDVAAVNALQDQLTIEYLNGYQPEPFQVTNWDMTSFEQVHQKYVAEAQAQGVQGTMGTVDAPVSLDAKNRGVAIATGLLPDKDAVYLTEQHRGEMGKTYKATYAVPEQADPELGFYSVTIYGDDQYLKTDEGSTISNKELLLNDDGKSFDIYYVPEAEFGQGGHANELIIPTATFWTAFRVYMPGESVIDGSYKTPELELAD